MYKKVHNRARRHETERVLPSLTELRALFRGRVLAPGDSDYDEARTLYNRWHDRRPAAIVRVADVEDISQAVSLARDTGAELAVKSGGHSVAGHSMSEGGLVIDLTDMRALHIDPQGRSAWAQAGLTAGEFTGAAGGHGLATGFGDTGSVGLGGITLGGGIGYLVRKHGLTVDSLLGAEVVTADGKFRRVDDGSEPELFWAIRGGGGNFGVVSRFRYRLHEIDEVLGGMLLLPATPETVASFIKAADDAPEELSTIANVMTAPPMPFLAPEHHGKVVVMALMVYAGDVGEGQRALAPFRELSTPLADMVRPIKYPEMFPADEGGPHWAGAAARSMFVDHVDESVAEFILERLQVSSAPMKAAQLRVLGGAMARVPVEATAFAHRHSRILVNLAALYEDPSEASVHERWVHDFMRALLQDDRGVYVNFLADEGEERIRRAYPPDTWKRLSAVKARYDPTNLFHLNQNIPPAAAA